ncbi:MAG: hypothetical protein ACHQ53_05515, partial [Polyangiales bacterium]
HAWLAVLLCGCSAFAQKSDYFDYRAVRMERDDARRLIAMQRYVSRHRGGRWYEEVQRERLQRDQTQFEAGKSDRAGLELYLAAFPDGVFVGQAKSRLAAIDVITRRKQDEALRAKRLDEERKRQEAELSRTWVTRFFGYWVKTLIGLSNWGEPIERVAHGNPEFSRAFGRPPRPRCTANECVKYYESQYAVPVPGGTRLERSMSLLLRLRIDQGRVVRAELLLPSLGFSRWAEVEERSAVVDGDEEGRQRAVDWALARIAGVLDVVARDRKPLPAYVLREIPRPELAANGELVDTTAVDPSAPANRIQGEAPSAPEPTVEQMIKPTAKDQAPDIEMAPLQVGPNGASSGGTAAVAPVPTQPAPASSGEVLEMAPLAVPQMGAGQATEAAASPPPDAGAVAPNTAPAAIAAPPRVQAFQFGALQIVLFAAGAGAAAPAYDGLALELVPPAAAKPGTKDKGGKRGPKPVASKASVGAAAPAGH